MERIQVELWHAYLMEDGEILICEYRSPEKVIWSSTFDDDYFETKFYKYLDGFELGYVGPENARDVYLLANGGAVINRHLVHASSASKPRLTTYRRSCA